MPKSRSSAALWRVLGLGLFLFGLLYTHAASPDTTVSHLASDKGVSASGVHFEPTAERENVASATSMQEAGEQPDGHHDGHGQQHAGEECVVGQPSQGPAMAVPCLSPLSSESGDEAPGFAPARHTTAARDFATPRTQAADSAVLRI
ncbi:hypothetical protein G5C60_15840 [Streptomyces sp. HC44]|uniref:Uncharacterized protein n=1 Tax=Streptomyces scabichelini TaxID=2711217 RepID=A0A6G4V4N0_9ACTN|nr:hypothetical protein [Streptomyces scabichelini]NGO09032.1 hypothetical protein [Streptomyces scabichelini]